MSYKKLVLDVLSIANDVDLAKSYVSIIEDAPAIDAKRLHDALLNLGFKNDKAHSTCSVALYEANLVKGNKRVNIVAASFAGSYIDVTVTI